ncbi:MAG TPA: gamma-glutamylcyclotransferase [Candidatus Pelagibacter sp.]|jgi:gamma-glutamylcyclotransferase (GGCT)/AIG2-like uncharacterized protein YtfP|nr:gamma-glutamylcyclotransferase [Candidatus Pelagibacter sp.]
MIYYFAYGSNLHHLQMKRRCPKCRYIKKIVLKNFQLTFRNKGGWADIERRTNKKVYGALYVISEYSERRLDKYEDYPTIYKKMYFKYKDKKVMTYTMVRKTKSIPPTNRYLNIIKQGYKDCKLSTKSLNVALQPLKHLQR